MSRTSQHLASEPTRVEYSEPEQLDLILQHLRRVRDQAPAANGAARARIAPIPLEPLPEKPAAEPVPKIEIEDEKPTKAAEAAVPAPALEVPESKEQPAPKPAEETPAADKASTADKSLRSAMRHLPEGAADRLAAFAGRSTEKPAPIPAPLEAPVASPTTASSATSPAEMLALPATGARGRGELKAAIFASRKAFIATGVFSLAINVLMLAGPLFMLQVYDRVMTSGSIPTLIALSALTTGLYAVIGLLELVRSRVIVRVGVELDRRVGNRVFQASLVKSLQQPGTSLLALRELDGLRQFIAGPGPLTFFDAPWTPIYLLVVFMLHWSLGLAAMIGAALLIVIAWLSEMRSRQPMAEAGKAAARSLELAETGQRNAEAITAMGMLRAYRDRWQRSNGESLAWQVLAADRLGTLSSLSKTLRLLLQSLMLAVGAALAIKGEISAGSIVAGTILFGRALAPVEQAIGHWRSFIKARESYAKVENLLAEHPEPSQRTSLPTPKGLIDVSNVRVAAPDTRTVILANINFSVEPGKMVAVIGPSASGKSTLARTLVGLWPAFSGQIRLDGALLDQWNPEELGQHIGYLPQNVELFAGTVRENISRFRTDIRDEDVIEAAKAAHAHEMITALPQGYETQLGNFGTYLSAGQRQRIGLARALFANPAFVVLDEPNSNLDRIGDEALSSAIDGMRSRGQSVVLVSHRVQAIGKADFLLYLERGTQRAFGPRAEVIRMLQAGMNQPAQSGPERAGAPAASQAQNSMPSSSDRSPPKSKV